jgi:hypothetical protein
MQSQTKEIGHQRIRFFQVRQGKLLCRSFADGVSCVSVFCTIVSELLLSFTADTVRGSWSHRSRELSSALTLTYGRVTKTEEISSFPMVTTYTTPSFLTHRHVVVHNGGDARRHGAIIISAETPRKIGKNDGSRNSDGLDKLRRTIALDEKKMTVAAANDPRSMHV